MSLSILCNTATIIIIIIVIIIIIIVVVVVTTTTTVTTVEVIQFRSRTNDSVNQYSLYQSFTGVVCHSLQFPTSQLPSSVSAWRPLYRSFLVGLCTGQRYILIGSCSTTRPHCSKRIRTINTTGAAKGILRLPHRWQRVVHNAGDYIEGQ